MTMIQHADLGLEFGAIDLLSKRHSTSDAFKFDIRAEGTEWGNPEQIVRAIETFLIDGAIQVVDGYSNREMPLEVCISGPNSAALAAGEKVLFLEVAKLRNALTWTPPDVGGGSGEPCVFDVVTARLDHSFDDMNELRVERFYKLTITALPWSHAEIMVSVTAAAPPNTSPTVVQVDACTSTTGWTGLPNAATTSSGSVFETAGNTGSTTVTRNMSLTRSGLAISMTSTPYVRIDFIVGGYGPAIVSATPTQVSINGTVVAPSAISGSVGWYLCPSGTLNSVQVARQVQIMGGYNSNSLAGIEIRDISRSDMAQDQAGARQVFRTFDVQGSARAQGNLSLADPTAALGSVLVYTTPGGGATAQPPLRARRSSGSAETPDTTLVSGKYSDLSGTLHTFDIPAANVPAGAYQLMARVKHASNGARTITYAGKSMMGTNALDAGWTGSTKTDPLVAGVWTIVPIEILVLPTYSLGSAGYVRIELSSPDALLLDEAWLFNIDQGDLTWVECGTSAPAAGGAASKLFLDAANLANPSPSVSMGTAADRTDSYAAGYPAMRAFGRHECTPPSLSVFTVTTNAVAAALTLSYYPSFHTHVL